MYYRHWWRFFGIVGIYGFNGWINQFLRLFGQQLPDIYGLSGILIAHLFSIFR